MSVSVEVTDNGVSVDFTTGITDISGASDTQFTNLQVDDYVRWNGAHFVNVSVPGGGATNLAELTDVNNATPTNRNALVADGIDWESRPLVEADISDLQVYLVNPMVATLNANNQDVDNAKTVTFNAEITNTGTTQTIDWTAGQKQNTTITAATTIAFTDPAGACNLQLKITNGGTGAITWPVTVLWVGGGTEPTWTTTGVDIVSFYFDGTNYYGMAGLNFA